MKKLVSILILMSSILVSTSSFAATCAKTYLSPQKIVSLVDTEYGEGASELCRFFRVGGLSSDFLFGRVSCVFNGRVVVGHIYGEDTGGIIRDEKCDVYLD